MTMLEERVAAPAATFSITGGLAQDYIDRGEMIPWSGTLVVEGGDTGDKRSIEMGALTTRPLPMPFMVQLENPVGGDGHDGATLTGRIDTIERLDDGRWWGTGFIDPTSGDVGGVPVGTQLALALDKQMIRGVSVDLDQVSITELRTKDGPKQVITAGRIIGATATPFQAFVECEIALDVDRMALAASADWARWEDEIAGHLAQVWTPVDAFETLVAFAGAIPVDPPLAWFARRKFTEFTPLTVLPTGQVYGHIAGKGTCHIGFSGKCEPLPSSHTNYAKFRNASVLTAEGTMVRTGPIVMDTVHPDLRWKASDAQTFYADTGAAVCDVVPYDDEFGMAVVGAMRPDVAPARIRAFRGSDISPDWRNIDGYRRECCALLAVNNSGFKLPQTLTASAGMFIEPGDTAIALDADDDVYALVASGPMRTEPCCAACAGHDHADELVADADTGVDTSARDIRIGAVRQRFSVDTFADTEAAVERDDELDDEDTMRRAAVRARFTKKKKKMPRYFRVAFGTTVTDVVAEFTGTSDGARKAWGSRDRAATEVERGTGVDRAAAKHGVPAEAIRAELQRRKRVHDSERAARNAAPRHPDGAHVVVAHDMSDAEPGVVQGSTNAAPGEQIVYTVKFEDGTISSWPASKVKPAAHRFRVASPKAEAAAAAEFAGALQTWLDALPGPRAFRLAAGEFAGNSDGARKAWESRKKNSGSKPVGKPSQPAAPKPQPKLTGKVGSSNHVGDALLHSGVPYSQASKIAGVVGGDYKKADGIDVPDDAIGDALLMAGYKYSEAIAVIDQVKAARTKLDSKAHVKAVKAAAAAPAKKEPTLDKAHVESLFAKPAAKAPAGAKYSPATEPRDEHGKPVDFSDDVNQPVRPDMEGDWYANHMESGSFQTDAKNNYVAYNLLTKGGGVRKVTQGVRWSENTYSQKPDHARRVWRNRGAISDALAASPNVKKPAGGLINGGRTRVVFNDDGTMDIFNFDYSSQPPHATGVPAVK